MSGLSSHVLDTVAGHPAMGVAITLVTVEQDGAIGPELAKAVTNDDGRTDPPLLDGDTLSQGGTFELRFDLGSYFAATAAGAGFLGVVPVRFTVAAGTTKLHVPLLASPWSYTTYRGS
jgi:5-hydroxyisourate hydrolase